MSADERNAVLLLAHGSPDSVDEIPEFLNQITRGRPVPPEVIEEVKHRYGLIGRSPLTVLTLRQGELLAEELKLPVYVGMRNWKPFIADTIAAMKSDGVARAVVICLAPQNSRTSVGLYRAALNVEGGTPFAVEFVESWHDHPLLIAAFAEKFLAGWRSSLRRNVRRVSRSSLPRTAFLSAPLPKAIPTKPRPRKPPGWWLLRQVSRPNDWKFAFQSQGMSGGAWLGPTVENTILELKEQGHRGVFVQPIGFLCDHVEVLYDIDIGFKEFAEKEGVRLWRAESLNDSRLLTAALAGVARSRLGE